MGRPRRVPARRTTGRSDEPIGRTRVAADGPGKAMTLASIRATGRVAWRQARRAPWRSALVAAMVAIPIAALSGTAIVIQTVIPNSRQLVAEDMGTSDIVIRESSKDLRPEALLHELPAGTRVIEGLSLASQNIVRSSVV